MAVPREVILDLMPLYLAGEASPASRALVEEHLREDPEFARRVSSEWTTALGRIAPPDAVPEIGLRALRRTRRVLTTQRWLFALGTFFTLSTFSAEISFEGAHFTEAHFLMRDYPLPCVASLLVGLTLFGVYAVLRRRLRTGGGGGMGSGSRPAITG